MANSLSITYIGGPTVLLEFNGIRLLTDPVFDSGGSEYENGVGTLRKLTDPAMAVGDLGAIDYVLLSHDHHADHLGHAGRAALGLAKAVLTTEDGAQRLGGHSVGLRPWQSMDLPGAHGEMLRVVAAPARHETPGPVIGFVLFPAQSDQKAVYVSGDTIWFEGVAEVARRFQVRAVVLHLGAASFPAVGPVPVTMTAREGVEAARAFAHATIIPVHFEGWEHFREGAGDIWREFAGAGLEHRLRWPEQGKKIRVAWD
ncbi:MAG: MBL fold metallo-hydrolase [Acidobacteria bacterium]|nr:MBL fold metallo-hydrolase [Acidobacteriota bacterium]